MGEKNRIRLLPLFKQVINNGIFSFFNMVGITASIQLLQIAQGCDLESTLLLLLLLQRLFACKSQFERENGGGCRRGVKGRVLIL